MVSFPYYSHTTPIRIPKDMGIVWETYHKGVPLLGVPENTLDHRQPRHLWQNWKPRSGAPRAAPAELERFGPVASVRHPVGMTLTQTKKTHKKRCLFLWMHEDVIDCIIYYCSILYHIVLYNVYYIYIY